jgi:hypothetical protein
LRLFEDGNQPVGLTIDDGGPYIAVGVWGNHLGAPRSPCGGRTLWIEVDDKGLLPGVVSRPRKVEGKRGFADTALLVNLRDDVHIYL